MLTITSNEQAESLIKNGVLSVDDDIEIAFDEFKIEADINCRNIYSQDHPRNIYANNIDACDIDARNIDASNITAHNIDACDIYARNIDAGNIDAGNIDAWDINYYAVCFAHNDIICTSITGGRPDARHFCLDGKITIKENENVN